jgi:hypothetical protein
VIVEKLENITAFTLSMPAGSCPLDPAVPPTIVIEKISRPAPPVFSDRSWTVHCQRDGEHWIVRGDPPASDGLVKRHGLQGPIDDAFLDSFVMVTPTGESWHPAAGAWCAGEQEHAVAHWRQQFRGDARIVADRDVSDTDVAAHNLILWGDPSSNAVLAKIADRLPIGWTKESITVGDTRLPSASHGLIMIYPNPLNPERYVVLSSGFTYREYDYLNNARQVSKLPDWAVVDLASPPTTQLPGAIPLAGFFDDQWRLPKVLGAPEQGGALE